MRFILVTSAVSELLDTTMKNHLWFFYLFFCCKCYGFDLRVGNPDDTAKIERPCPVYDLNCIREFFASHAHCTKTFGPAPDPFVRPFSSVYAPRINVTVALVEEVVGGLNGRIEEFYVNRDTDNMVITIEFRNFSLSSEKVYYTFHRRAKEPVVTTAFASVLYESVAITAIIPRIDDLQLSEAESTVFVNDITPTVVVGPNAAVSDDPQVQLAITELVTSNFDVSEVFLTENIYPLLFIQYNICDFGLKIE